MEKVTGRLALVSVILGICVVTLLPVHSGLLARWQSDGGLPLSPASLRADLGILNWFDATQNVLLFIPLGFLVFGNILPGRRRGRGLCAAVAGLTLSCAVEIIQSRIPGRFPSLTDILFNGCGSLLGGYLASRYPIRPEAEEVRGSDCVPS